MRSVPSAGMRWHGSRSSHKTEPGTKPLCCWPPFLLPKPSRPLLPFPFRPPGCLGSERPRCLLGMARKGSPWASRAASQAWASACSETTQPSVQVTGVGGGRGVGSSAPRSQSAGDVTPSYPGRAWKEEDLPNSVSRLSLLLSASTRLPQGHTLLRKRAPASLPL